MKSYVLGAVVLFFMGWMPLIFSWWVTGEIGMPPWKFQAVSTTIYGLALIYCVIVGQRASKKGIGQ